MPIIVVHSLAISIHAPHEGVRLDFSNFPIRIFISIHAPHEGVRRFRCDRASIHYRFQSTHPTRGCDGLRKPFPVPRLHFNPRTPRGGATFTFVQVDIVIYYFNPRTPRGGATCRNKKRFRKNNFNPRTPRGGATPVPELVSVNDTFQSTHPTRGCDKGKVIYHGKK